ncbi:hypothetical protein AVEN_9008-1 [Araneus ventricosus]|uniref:Uncharacterized protein n=1 Tax=Araneus ventricosus TaxID=182803 RepID=A0A4Y2DSM3_ARAVE|nr:hypothetical protein AVEN_9008-1 [Araneus ventricosus]
MENTCYTESSGTGVQLFHHSSICDNYVTYVRTKNKSTAIVIFDGYIENETVGGIKCAERARRSLKQMSSEVMFDETMVPTVSQEKFLANPKNKNQFISILMNKFSSVNMPCKKTDKDADGLIVSSVLALAPTHPSVVVIVLCLHCWDNSKNRKIQIINSDEDDDGEPILPDDLVEASLSLHVEEDTYDLPEDIQP